MLSVNTGCAIYKSVEDMGLVNIIDNSRLEQICRDLGGENSWGNMNHLVVEAMLGFSAPLHSRVEGDEVGTTLAKLTNSLVPYPRTHFFSISQAPLWLPNQPGIIMEDLTPTVEGVTKALMRSDHSLSTILQRDGGVMCEYISLRTERMRPVMVGRAKSIIAGLVTTDFSGPGEVAADEFEEDDEVDPEQYQVAEELPQLLSDQKGLEESEPHEEERAEEQEDEEDTKPIKSMSFAAPLFTCSLSARRPLAHTKQWAKQQEKRRQRKRESKWWNPNSVQESASGSSLKRRNAYQQR